MILNLRSPRKPGLYLACGLLLLFGAILFVNRAGVHGRQVNTDDQATDQNAYISYAYGMHKTHFAYVGARNRMPLYPAILALLIEDKQSKQEIFERGKGWNTWLSLAGLGVVGVVLFKRLPLHPALNALFLVAFTLYVFKAAYVQSELLYYTFTWLLFAAAWEFFLRPGWWLACGIGVLAGITHLTKASVAPGLFCLLVFFALDTFWKMRRGESTLPGAFSAVGQLALILLCFLSVIFPYIQTSHAIYGHYFHNVNSTYYFWCDSWKECQALIHYSHGRYIPAVGEADVPSLAKYWRQHSGGDIAQRLLYGCRSVWRAIGTGYGYQYFAKAFALAGLALIGWRRRSLWKIFCRRPLPALALLAYFAGSYLLVAWYTPIAAGNRFILVLYLPFIFTIYRFLATCSRGKRLRWKNREYSAFTVFNWALSIALVVQILVVSLKTIHTTYGGS